MVLPGSQAQDDAPKRSAIDWHLNEAIVWKQNKPISGFYVY